MLLKIITLEHRLNVMMTCFKKMYSSFYTKVSFWNQSIHVSKDFLCTLDWYFELTGSCKLKNKGNLINLINCLVKNRTDCKTQTWEKRLSISLFHVQMWLAFKKKNIHIYFSNKLKFCIAIQFATVSNRPQKTITKLC